MRRFVLAARDRLALNFRPRAKQSEKEEETISDGIAFRGSYAQCLDHSLVLSSQNIPHYIQDSEDHSWEIRVPQSLELRAQNEIIQYLDENQGFRTSQPLPPLLLSLQPFWVLAIPLIITLLQFSGHISNFDSKGMNAVQKTLHGEWWRIYTALTLHGSSNHLVSNLLPGYFILSLLAGRIALTRIVPLLFLVSGFANLCVAFTVTEEFRSLGFSTFVFASLGALASIEWRNLPLEKSLSRFKRATPLISAFFLTVMMGLGENSDILAHFYGFAWGIIAGLLPRRRNIQGLKVIWGLSDWMAVVCVVAWITLCWQRALN
jgi:membrane associated rhomboid family serine protease